MARLSFDFDDTLSRASVRAFAGELAGDGAELWIVTMRFASREEMARRRGGNGRAWPGNQDLFEAASGLGIPQERIVFTNWRWKSAFLRGRGFLLHVDDCKHTLAEIRRAGLGVRPVNCWRNGRWKTICRAELARWQAGRALG